jgi:tripartite-type tricarboxylate transporter receptor subunit TctC
MIVAKNSVMVSLAGTLMVAAGGVGAQAYPVKTVRIIVPFPPGGATDILGRYLGLRLGEIFGQQFIVDNRGGANGTLGLDIAAKTAPDGYALVIGQTGNLTISPGLQKLAYDPVRDFSPLTLLVDSPHVVAVHPSLPVRSLKDLVALARAKPGQLSYASSGNGSPGHLGVELFKKMAKIDIVHIPYKGAAPGFTDLVAGHVQVYFTSSLSTQQFIKSGRVRVLAVGSVKRSPSLPDLPTIAESGYPGFEVTSWWGALGPAGMPREIVTRLNSEIVKIMATPDARERMAALGADIVTGTPEQFADYIKVETAKWGQLIRETGTRLD